MSNLVVGIIGIIVVMVLIFSRMQVGFAMITVGFFGLCLFLDGLLDILLLLRLR